VKEKITPQAVWSKNSARDTTETMSIPQNVIPVRRGGCPTRRDSQAVADDSTDEDGFQFSLE